MNGWRWLGACLLTSAAAFAQAEEKGFTLRDLDVRGKPFLDSETVGKLPQQAPVTVITRQGGWIQIKADKTQGWVRLLSVRLGNPDPARNESSVASVFGAGRRGSSTATVTTGVRGFSEEDLKQAQPNPEEAKKMEGYAAGINSAAFAASGSLTPQNVPYFDAEGQPEGGKK
ncbi:MAG: SH3 domain-containing protein [Betaproteobacteria bacterium]|nr:SH3 domain-containing protein [Betaproteobacteria bacterium]